MNLFLHHQDLTIRTKGLIVKLGLRTATIYVPNYNLIKEVPWKGSTSYLDRDTVEVRLSSPHPDIILEYHKNQTIDVELGAERHQQIQLRLILNKDTSDELVI